MKQYGQDLLFRNRVVFQALIVFSVLLLLLIYYCYIYSSTTVSSLSSIDAIYIIANSDDVRSCFVDHSSQQHTVNGLQHLEDVLLSDRKPSPGRSIFFHETSCNISSKFNQSFGSSVHSDEATDSIMRLNPRQACAVESAALHNPNFDIFVLFASAAYSDNTASQPFLEAVLSYSNVHLRKLNLWSYAADTPIYEWLKEGELFTSKYVVSHISDFLRFLTLWRWGGTYLDLDVIVQKSLEDIPPNYSGAENVKVIGSAVMNFSPDGFGHEVAEQCLRDFQQNFNGSDWAKNGPGVITRVMKNVCRTPDIDTMNRERCLGFNVFPNETFYAISWRMWKNFFKEQYLEETLNQTVNSYVVHVWNKNSIRRRVKVGSNVAYGKLAEQHCPKVYAACGEFF